MAYDPFRSSPEEKRRLLRKFMNVRGPHSAGFHVCPSDNSSNHDNSLSRGFSSNRYGMYIAKPG